MLKDELNLIELARDDAQCHRDINIVLTDSQIAYRIAILESRLDSFLQCHEREEFRQAFKEAYLVRSECIANNNWR